MEEPMLKLTYVDTSYPKDALERLYRSEHDGRVKERLLAIVLLYEGKSITRTAQLVRVSRQSLTTWLKTWNQGSYQGIKPNFIGGYAGRLSQKEWDELVASLKGKDYDIEQVRQQLLQEKGVSYTCKVARYKCSKQYK